MKRLIPAVLGLAGAGAAAWSYARYVEPDRIQVRALELRLPRLDSAFDGYRIVHLSDLHIDGVMSPRRMAKVAALARSARPDMVAFTGDFVTAKAGFDAVELVRFLRALSAPDGVFAVLGNHDHVGHVHALREALTQAEVVELPNRAYTLRRDSAVLHLTGVDSLYHQLARPDLALANVPDDGNPLILLAHEPDIADLVAPLGRVALQLSGHAHGGQVALGPLTALGLPEHGRRYVDGLYLVGRVFVYSNRGLGMTSAPLRLNSRPEIAVITLRV